MMNTVKATSSLCKMELKCVLQELNFLTNTLRKPNSIELPKHLNRKKLLSLVVKLSMTRLIPSSGFQTSQRLTI